MLTEVWGNIYVADISWCCCYGVVDGGGCGDGDGGGGGRVGRWCMVSLVWGVNGLHERTQPIVTN